MIVRVLVQEHPETGEQHVTFTTDSVTPRSDMLCAAPGWETAKVTEGTVLLLGLDTADDAVIEALLETELHTAMTPHELPALDNIKIHQILQKLMENSNAPIK